MDEAVAEDVLHNEHYDAFFERFQPAVREQFVRQYVSRRNLLGNQGA
ncbi:hypothetical protein [Hymenobacter terricola]|nr:hypothetical protein [Hymenobacter terricola]